MFIVGLIGGLLTFGGAYTAIPMVRMESVTIAGWLTSAQFVDGLALGSIFPTPLVMFISFVGYMAAGIGGSFLGTIGMFIPALSFTIIGHEIFERIVEISIIRASLEGIAAAVSGLVSITAIQLLRTAVRNEIQAIIFIVSLLIVYFQTHPVTSLGVVLGAIVAGQVLFVDDRFND